MMSLSFLKIAALLAVVPAILGKPLAIRQDEDTYVIQTSEPQPEPTFMPIEIRQDEDTYVIQTSVPHPEPTFMPIDIREDEDIYVIQTSEPYPSPTFMPIEPTGRRNLPHAKDGSAASTEPIFSILPFPRGLGDQHATIMPVPTSKSHA